MSDAREHTPAFSNWGFRGSLMAAKEQLHYEGQTRCVQDLVNLYCHRQLNLEPGFQRQSVWTDGDRAKLVDSVFRNYPIPALFLHRNEEQGELYYDVIDGKQRRERIQHSSAMAGSRFCAGFWPHSSPRRTSSAFSARNSAESFGTSPRIIAVPFATKHSSGTTSRWIT